MSEPAKQAAYPILRKYINTKRSAIIHIGNIIDTEFAEVFKERDDLKKALGELRRAVLQHGIVVADCHLRLSDLTTVQVSAALKPVMEDLASALVTAEKMEQL